MGICRYLSRMRDVTPTEELPSIAASSSDESLASSVISLNATLSTEAPPPRWAIAWLDTKFGSAWRAHDFTGWNT